MAAKPKPIRESKNPHKGAGGKTPKSEFNINVAKVPRTSTAIEGLDCNDRRVQFTFCDSDLDGPWSLAEIEPDHVADLFRFLKTIETHTFGELTASGTGLYKEYSNFEKCPNGGAIQRLADLYDSADNICRLSLGGKPRLYGLRFEHVIALLWWDPEHEIWPSQLKHT